MLGDSKTIDEAAAQEEHESSFEFWSMSKSTGRSLAHCLTAAPAVIPFAKQYRS
jgi:hypothetical protein